MLRDFFNNFIVNPWRLDIMPHLHNLGQSRLFWSIAAMLLLGLLIYRVVRKR